MAVDAAVVVRRENWRAFRNWSTKLKWLIGRPFNNSFSNVKPDLCSAVRCPRVILFPADYAKHPWYGRWDEKAYTRSVRFVKKTNCDQRWMCRQFAGLPLNEKLCEQERNYVQTRKPKVKAALEVICSGLFFVAFILALTEIFGDEN